MSQILKRFFAERISVEETIDNIEDLASLSAAAKKNWITSDQIWQFVYKEITRPVVEGRFTKLFSENHMNWLRGRMLSFYGDKQSVYFLRFPKNITSKQIRSRHPNFWYVGFYPISTNKGIVYLCYNKANDLWLFFLSHFFDRYAQRTEKMKRTEAMKMLAKSMMDDTAISLFDPDSVGFRLILDDGIGLGYGLENHNPDASIED